MTHRSFYQITPIARSRDAVGRMALGLQHLLKDMGFRSLLFTERQQSLRLGSFALGNLRKGLLSERPIWGGEKESLPAFSLYHHSIGTIAAERFLGWPAEKRILVYHNITPAEVLEQAAPGAGQAAEWGRSQLPLLVEKSDLQIGLSALTCKELAESGARSILQLPYFLWRRDWKPPSRAAREPWVLVVGRVEPQKRVLEGVEAFRVLLERNPRARLFIVGNLKGQPAYVRQVREAISRHGLENSVTLTGKISDRRLERLYLGSQALLTLSEHEGFCVPIVEAMRAAVPIVGFDAGAVSETLGRGGVLVSDRDPRLVANALFEVMSDLSLRQRILLAQENEVERFSPVVFADGFSTAMARLGGL